MVTRTEPICPVDFHNTFVTFANNAKLIQKLEPKTNKNLFCLLFQKYHNLLQLFLDLLSKQINCVLTIKSMIYTGLLFPWIGFVTLYGWILTTLAD